jgi:hypothetical protein
MILLVPYNSGNSWPDEELLAAQEGPRGVRRLMTHFMSTVLRAEWTGNVCMYNVKFRRVRVTIPAGEKQ